MKKLPLLLFASMLCANFVRSQKNLVVNPGFEDIGSNDPGSHELKYLNYPGWSDPTDGTSDVSIEKKKHSKKYARFSVASDSGLAHAGFYGSRQGEHWAEYIQGTLSSPLLKKKKYVFSVSLKNSSDDDVDVINYISVSLSNESRHDLAKEHQPIFLKPDFTLSKGKNIVQTNGWTRYTVEFVANGGEQFFIIGTFALHPVGDHYNYDHSPYFCVDNFSLTALNPPGPIPDYVFDDDSTASNQFRDNHTQGLNSTFFQGYSSDAVWNYSTPDIITTKTRRPFRPRLKFWFRR